MKTKEYCTSRKFSQGGLYQVL